MSADVRTRFAPSPTGRLHLGNVRTALFNFLLAEASGGAFVVRAEDTDPERSVEAHLDAQLDDLRWLGLHWHEGPDIGGRHGPYRQSERHDTCRELIARLQERGRVYPCWRTGAELRDLTIHSSSETALSISAGQAPEIQDCLFTANRAEDAAAIACWAGSAPVIRGCTVSGNTTLHGDAILLHDSRALIADCIVWHNAGGSLRVEPLQRGGELHPDRCGVPPLWLCRRLRR